MPEGDTIAKLATRINDAVAGRVVERTITRDPRLVGVNLDGNTLTEAVNIGKFLMLRFRPPSGTVAPATPVEPTTLFHTSTWTESGVSARPDRSPVGADGSNSMSAAPC